MDVFVRIETYDGHRNGYPRDMRPKSKPRPRNDYIWHAKNVAPSSFDWKYYGYIRVLCQTQNEVRVVLQLCEEFIAEGFYTLRIVWNRTPFTLVQLRKIQRTIPLPEDSLPPIPRLTFAEFKAATLPIHTQLIVDYFTSARDALAEKKATAESLASKADSDAERKFWQQEAVAAEEQRVDMETKRKRYAPLVSKEEPSEPFRTEVLPPPK